MEKGIITCIYKKPELSIFGEFINDFTGLYNNHNEYSKKSNLIIEYDSDKIIKEILEEKSKSKIKKICVDFYYPTPRHIQFIDVEKIFFKYDTIVDDNIFIKYDNLVVDNSLPKHYQKLFGQNIMEITEKSIYNCAYYTYKTIEKKEIFGIRKLIQQNRYIFTYDSNYLSRNQFETIISIIFLN